jgi:hypothetical protein
MVSEQRIYTSRLAASPQATIKLSPGSAPKEEPS